MSAAPEWRWVTPAKGWPFAASELDRRVMPHGEEVLIRYSSVAGMAESWVPASAVSADFPKLK